MVENGELCEAWRYEISPAGQDYRYKGKVVLYYGPYETFHTTKHLPYKLRGLKDMLVKEGYKVVCTPWQLYNRMAIVVNGNIIFICKYSSLHFDGFGQSPLTKEGFKVTIEALNRINGWYLTKISQDQNPMDFFSRTIGK